MAFRTPGAPPAGWDVKKMDRTLRDVSMTAVMRRSAGELPHSPLFEYVMSRASSSPRTAAALSQFSEDSLDSVVTSSAGNSMTDDAFTAPTSDEAETNELIYRLCRSLYGKTLQKTEGRHGDRSSNVNVDEKRERNMSRMTDWMPLLHLFDPKSFYELHSPTAKASGESAEVPIGLQRAKNPREASRHLRDELEVEKLSGGNSNHVYRLCHPQFPEKSILLRVYGGGDAEAIDRYRDVAAMKQMSEAGLSPAVLHTFKWGRVEEFMDDVATASTDMLIDSPTLLSNVYEVLHQMHQLPATNFFPEAANKQKFKNAAALSSTLNDTYTSPDDYLRRISERLQGAISVRAKSRGSGAPDETTGYYLSETDIKVMEEICPTAFERATLRFLRMTSPSIKSACRQGFVEFVAHEVVAVREYLQHHGTPVAFSHNDLNPGNILLSRRKVPTKFRTPTTAGSPGSPAGTAFLEDDDDVVTPIVSKRSSMLSRRFVTVKGRDKNLVELKGVVFIDFEYSDANYRAFDLGNTFCELDYDYSRGTEDGGPGFIKYLSTFPPPDCKARWEGLPPVYPRMPELIFLTWESLQNGQHPLEGVGASCLRAVAAYFRMEDGSSPRGERQASHLPNSVTQHQLTEVFLGMLASHLHWAMWSFAFARNPDDLTNQTVEDDTFAKGSSGLDYVRYGDCRLKEYLALKAWMKERKFI